jgi:hypothetical protein
MWPQSSRSQVQSPVLAVEQPRIPVQIGRQHGNPRLALGQRQRGIEPLAALARGGELRQRQALFGTLTTGRLVP